MAAMLFCVRLLFCVQVALAWVPCAQPPRVARPLAPAVRHARRAGDVQLGVPKFFRWLTERFPQINLRVKGGRRVAEIDNFYLDMNGIIHTCTHGDGIRPGQVMTEEQQFEAIFEYTERLVSIARPRKVLYLAIDGVAPRAKMNQQRSRRYRVPRELALAAAKEEALNAARGRAWEKDVGPPPGTPPPPPPFNSNCITPGTEYLYELGDRFREWIKHKMATDPDWMNGPQVIFSGAEVPGEGEHKIMDYIRDCRRENRWAEDTRHCMYGLDADLIMLGMVTHEDHFSLLRERQRFQRGKFAPRSRGKGGGRGRGRGDGGRGSGLGAASGREGGGAPGVSNADDEDFVFLELELLRSLLAGTMRPGANPNPNPNPNPNQGTMRPGVASEMLGFEWLEERAVDDFVFMSMLVGNDFIPGLPHLSVEDL